MFCHSSVLTGMACDNVNHTVHLPIGPLPTGNLPTPLNLKKDIYPLQNCLGNTVLKCEKICFRSKH